MNGGLTSLQCDTQHNLCATLIQIFGGVVINIIPQMLSIELNLYWSYSFLLIFIYVSLLCDASKSRSLKSTDSFHGFHCPYSSCFQSCIIVCSMQWSVAERYFTETDCSWNKHSFKGVSKTLLKILLQYNHKPVFFVLTPHHPPPHPTPTKKKKICCSWLVYIQSGSRMCCFLFSFMGG